MAGTNAPLPTATYEQPDSAGQDGGEALIQPDDSMALPSAEEQESSDGSEAGVDVVQGEDEEPATYAEDEVTGKGVMCKEAIS